MKVPDARRLNIWTPLLFAGVLTLGMTLGFRMRDTLRHKRDLSAVVERNDKLEEIIDFVREKYVDSVDVNNLYRDATEGIISHLDPHTSYIPATELNRINEDLDGAFYGIGVEFEIVKDTIQVTAVVEKGPAEQAAVQVGDKIIRVNDSLVAGVGITSEHIIRMLRGEQFSRATLQLQSPGREAPRLRNAVITRDEIPIASVDASLLLNRETGYIRINRFAATTHAEFQRALRGLKKYSISYLLVDVRQNPGGFLEQAAAIADELLPDQQTIVITRSRDEEEIRKAAVPGLYETGKLAILVDEGSASAAEILAAAVQDNDRGLVVGRRTYGKGLVQEQYELDDGSALRLTVARYYTPSGRSLQRSYQAGRSAYEEDLVRRFQDGELTGGSTPNSTDTTVYYTKGRRKVHGGGGVTPDYLVPYDSVTFNTPLLNLAYGNEAGMLVWDYYLRNAPRINAFRNASDFVRHPEMGEELVSLLEKQLPEKDRLLLQEVRKKPGAMEFLKTQLRARVARIRFRSSGYYAITIPADPMVIRARQLLTGSTYEAFIGR